MFGFGKRRSLASAGLVDASTADNLKTILRIRGTEGIDNYDDEYLAVNGECNQILLKNEYEPNVAQSFTFNNILHPEENQANVYNHTTADLVDKVLNGKEACVFTYGASGSGKTFTIMGGQGHDEAGLLPRATADIFAKLGGSLDPEARITPHMCNKVTLLKPGQMEKDEKIKSELLKLSPSNHLYEPDSTGSVGSVPEGTIAVFVTFIELYNEKVYDLLRRSTGVVRAECKVRQDVSGFYVDGCRHIRVNSTEEALRIIEVGRANSTKGQTRLNQDSSRSHCIFTIRVCRQIPGKINRWAVSSLAFCDLAGVERRKKMGPGLNSARSAESKTINKSLMMLRQVISQLHEQQAAKHGQVAIPFRNSKLTQLMQNYLVGGDSSTKIIVAISNDPNFREETQQSLEFASKANAVSTAYDKDGRKSKGKSNVSVIKESSEEEDENGMPDYRSWKKEKMALDLEWYFEERKKLNLLVMKLKNGWKEEELEADRAKREWEDERKDLNIELYNARAEHHNEVEIMMDKFLKEKKQLRKQIKELQAADGGHNSTAAINQMETIQFLENEAKEHKMTAMALERDVSESKQTIQELERELAAKTSQLIAKTSSVEEKTATIQKLENEKMTLETNMAALQETYEGLQAEMQRKDEERNDLLFTINEDDLLGITKTIHKGSETMEFLSQEDMVPIRESDNRINSLQDENEKLIEEIENLKKDLEGRDSVIKKGRLSYMAMEETLSQKTEKVTELEHLVKMKEEKLGQCQSSTDELKASLVERVEQIKALRSELEVNRSENELLKTDSNQKQRSIRSLQDSIDSKIKSADEQKKVIDELREQLVSQEQKIADLNIEISSQAQLHDNSRQAADSEKSKMIATLETQKTALADKLEEQAALASEHRETIDRMEKESAQKQDLFDQKLTQINEKQEKLTKRYEQLEKDFEDSEDQCELLKSENDELREQLTDRCNETVNKELEERCFSLTNELDELTKKLHQSETLYSGIRQQLEAEKENHRDQVNELEEKFSAVRVTTPEDNTEEFTKLKADYAELNSKFSELSGKYDRSILRKQKERAVKQLEEEKAKVKKLELLLTTKENENAQLQSVVEHNHSDALDHVLVKSTTVKEEPQELPPTQPKVKEEPIDPFENIENLPRPIVEAPIKKAGRPKRSRKLAPQSPEAMPSPLVPTPSTRVTRARAAKK